MAKESKPKSNSESKRRRKKAQFVISVIAITLSVGSFAIAFLTLYYSHIYKEDKVEFTVTHITLEDDQSITANILFSNLGDRNVGIANLSMYVDFHVDFSDVDPFLRPYDSGGPRQTFCRHDQTFILEPKQMKAITLRGKWIPDDIPAPLADSLFFYMTKFQLGLDVEYYREEEDWKTSTYLLIDERAPKPDERNVIYSTKERRDLFSFPPITYVP